MIIQSPPKNYDELRASLIAILAAAKLDPTYNVWTIRISSEYMNVLRRMVDLGEVGRTEAPKEVTMWPDEY